VFPQAPGLVGERGGTPIKAGELQASVHSLEVLRLVAIPVQEVQIVNRASGGDTGDIFARGPAPSEKVSLSVRQPGRHSVFVSSGSSGMGSMAVASASVDVLEAANKHRVKNTFIEIPEDPGLAAPGPHRPRARSTPAVLQRGTCRHGRGEHSGGDSHSFRSVSSARASTVSYASSVMSGAPELGDATTQLVLGVDRAVERGSMGPAAQREFVEEVALSKVTEVLRQGLASIGSSAHKAGQCCPCLMETLHKTGSGFSHAPCRSGLLCGRCHEPHEKKDVTAIRTLRRKRAREAAARGK